ncbi:MAG: glycosyltransferase family 39 protein [Candidatus Didemnitutus sp.]|nr:glycosyltransferase family 39 protein [Candidatus Didemnitutus sp.]
MRPVAPVPSTRTWLLVAAALALYYVMAVSASPRLGVTADEVVHLTGGYTYWKFNDYRLHPENGTLPMRVSALPLLAMDLKFPPLEGNPDWLRSQVNTLGDRFFFGLGNPLDRMLLAGRAMTAFFGVFTVWLTWRWARGLFGATAGWIALALAVFCPALLAHGGLITSDMAATACMLGALTLAWRLLHRVTAARLAGTTLACGLTFLSKMSGVLIVPLLGALWAVRVWRGAPFVLQLGPARWVRGRLRIAAASLAVLAAVGAGSLVVLWAGYGFRFDGFNRARSTAESYYFSWDVILDKAPVPRAADTSLDRLLHSQRPVEETGMTHLLGWMREHRVLPEAYLFGFAHTYKFARYRPAFFLGEYRTTGWRTFFPVAFVLKTPLPALLLGVAGFAALLLPRAHRAPGVRCAWLYRAAPLAVFFVVYWTMAIRMNLNIGHRHILPTYPVFYVLASAAACWLAAGPRRLIAAALALAVAADAADSVAVRPFYLSYFQPLTGGVDRGYRYLVDSSYDWGQGLPDLAAWLDRRRARGDTSPVFLTYFGADSPRARRLDVIRFGDEWNDRGPRTFPAPVRGGWFVIGATHFQRAYLPTRGPWGERQEQVYKDLLQRAARAAAEKSPRPPAEQERVVQDLMDLELMQFGRLCHALRDRAPLEVVGGSLLVFRLSDAEVQAALYGPPR